MSVVEYWIPVFTGMTEKNGNDSRGEGEKLIKI